jgi:hypothetical protein
MVTQLIIIIGDAMSSDEGKVFRIRLDDTKLKEDVAELFENVKTVERTTEQGVKHFIKETINNIKIKIGRVQKEVEFSVSGTVNASLNSLRMLTNLVQNYNVLFKQEVSVSGLSHIIMALSAIRQLETYMAVAAASPEPTMKALIPVYAGLILSYIDLLAWVKMEFADLEGRLENQRMEQFERLLEVVQ